MMTFIVVRRLAFVVMALVVCFTLSTPRLAAEDLIYPGEDLTYSVSYLGIPLGTVRSVTEGWTTLGDRKVAKIKIYIDSHPSIPFVSLHSIYESYMDPSITYAHRFEANTQVEDGKWEFDQYLFDYGSNKLTIETFRGKQKIRASSFGIRKKYNDGSSILFAARRLMYSKKSLQLPTAIMGDTVNTVINFQGLIGEQTIDAVNYPIRTVYLNADAKWTGVYGLSGRCEGWFSDDDARIPIVAKMNVYVGSVRLELVKWKRGSWQPPRVQ
jgi:hypothetical protein